MKIRLCLSLALAAFTSLGCTSSSWGNRIEGDGVYVPNERSLQSFDRVKMSGGMKIDISVGGSQSVVIHADQNLQPFIRTRVEGGRLQIDFTESVSSSNSMRAEISVPSLAAIAISGSSEMNVSGIDEEEFSIDVSGSGKGTFSGRARVLEVDISGSGRLDLFELEADDVRVSVSGSGNLQVSASDALNVKSSGSGKVTYRGEPKLQATVSGSAKVVAEAGS